MEALETLKVGLIAAFTLWRDADRGDENPASIYGSSCFDVVIDNAALAERRFEAGEIWFDYFT